MLDDAVVALYLDWFNELLIQRKKDFLRHLFNYVMESGKMEVRDYRQKKPLKLHFREGKRYAFRAGRDISFPQSETYTREELLRMNTYICWNLLMGDIAAPLYTPVMRGRRNGEPVYLPASRTGFMLTYKQLLEQSIQANFSQTAVDDRGALTLPYVDFLQLITKFESHRANALADHLMPFLETYMTDGSFKIKRTILPDFQYTPKDVGRICRFTSHRRSSRNWHHCRCCFSPASISRRLSSKSLRHISILHCRSGWRSSLSAW